MNSALIKNSKFFAVGIIFSCLSLNAVTNKAETRGLFSSWWGEDNQTVAQETKTAPAQEVTQQNADVDAIIENLDQVSEDGLRCMKCCPPKRLKVCEVCAKRIYTMCLFAEIAKIKNLCTKRAKIEKIWAYVVNTCKLCAHKAKIEHLWSHKAFIECARLEKLCSEHANIETLHTDKTYTHTLCAKYARIKKLCAVDTCSNYKAHVSLSGPFVGYTLDAPIKFNTIVDDPNGNIDNSGPSTKYIIPKSGYYVFTMETDASNVRGPGIIVGQPVLHSQIRVNGIDVIHADVAMLSFANNVYTNLSGVLHVQKGDFIECAETVFVLDPTAGLINYVNGQLDFNNPIPPIPNHDPITYFLIHYLSSDCAPEDCACGWEECNEGPCDHDCFDMPDCDICLEECNIPCPDSHCECHDDCDNDHHECGHGCDFGHGGAPKIVIKYEHGHECGHDHDSCDFDHGCNDHGPCHNDCNNPPPPVGGPVAPTQAVAAQDELDWNFDF